VYQSELRTVGRFAASHASPAHMVVQRSTEAVHVVALVGVIQTKSVRVLFRSCSLTAVTDNIFSQGVVMIWLYNEGFVGLGLVVLSGPVPV